MSTFKSEVRSFADLDFGFNEHPVTSDVMKKTNIEAIKSSIRNLVSTNYFDRLFHPEIGNNISYLLFENYTPMVERICERMIVDTIENFEPRAKINSINVLLQDDNSARINITFTPLNINILVDFDILLERTR